MENMGCQVVLEHSSVVHARMFHHMSRKSLCTGAYSGVSICSSQVVCQCREVRIWVQDLEHVAFGARQQFSARGHAEAPPGIFAGQLAPVGLFQFHGRCFFTGAHSQVTVYMLNLIRSSMCGSPEVCKGRVASTGSNSSNFSSLHDLHLESMSRTAAVALQK